MCPAVSPPHATPSQFHTHPTRRSDDGPDRGGQAQTEVSCNPTARWALTSSPHPALQSSLHFYFIKRAPRSQGRQPRSGGTATILYPASTLLPHMFIFFSSKSSCKTASLFSGMRLGSLFGYEETPAQFTAEPSRAESVTSEWTDVPGHPHSSVRKSVLRRAFAINELQLKFFQKAFIESFHFLYD